MYSTQASVIIVTGFWGQPLFAKKMAIKIDAMTFSFNADQKFIPQNYRQDLNATWIGFCDELGSNFLVGKGPQGRGIVGETECFETEFSPDFKTGSIGNNLWHVAFIWGSKGLSAKIYFRTKGRNSEVVLLEDITFPEQLTPDLLFTSSAAKYHIIGTIYRFLPVEWNRQLKFGDMNWQLKPLDVAMSTVLPPAQKLGLFSLAYDTKVKLWIPTLYAIATPTSGEHATEDFDRFGNNPFEIRWVKQPRREKLRLWMKEIYNPLRADTDTVFLEKSAKEKNARGLFENLALEHLVANTFTLRSAIPYPKGKTVVGQAQKVEAILNVAQGLLNGLYLGLEHSPRVETKNQIETYSYTWTRIEAGWSFSLGLPILLDRFASRFRLTPKVGILSLDAYFPVGSDDNSIESSPSNYHLSRQLSVGGEFSWDFETLAYKWKVWGTSHLSGYVLAPKIPTKVSNQRAGGDFSVNIFKNRDGLKLSALIFGYIDWVALQATEVSDSDETVAEDTSASVASYSATYFGLGLAVTW